MCLLSHSRGLTLNAGSREPGPQLRSVNRRRTLLGLFKKKIMGGKSLANSGCGDGSGEHKLD